MVQLLLLGGTSAGELVSLRRLVRLRSMCRVAAVGLNRMKYGLLHAQVQLEGVSTWDACLQVPVFLSCEEWYIFLSICASCEGTHALVANDFVLLNI
jgi:hypothetical protein